MSKERQNKLTYNEVRYRQALPYEIKIRMSETRLREFIGYYGEDGVAVSFSGGLDSTFALAFIRERYPRVKAVSVFNDAGNAVYRNVSVSVHEVKAGDTLGKLAKQYGTTVEAIVTANKEKYPKITADHIVVGWKLKV